MNNDEVDNDNVNAVNNENDIAIPEVDNDNDNAVNNENEQQIDPNLNPVQQIDDEPNPIINQIMDEQYCPRRDA
jgi:hypothetical protein